LGKIKLSLNSTAFNIILPLLIQILNPLTNFSNLTFLLGKIRLPLNKWINNSISLLFCVTYLLVCADCAITLPNPKVSFINSKTCLSALLCVITKQRSPLLFTIKDSSPSVNPINQVKNSSDGWVRLGK
jgi:Na+-translocating ferredoxin:NAD+ oxidoreductase RnfD subunit